MSACVLTLSGAAWGADIKSIVESHRQEQISKTVELVKIPSYAMVDEGRPTNGVVKSLNYVLDLAKEWGFRTYAQSSTYWITGQTGPVYGYVEYGPEDAPEMIMSLAHLDTVSPGEDSLWPEGTGPYSGTFMNWTGDYGTEQYLFGRGTFDDKGPGLASLYALRAIKEAGIPLNRRIRLWFGTAEEGGTNTIADRMPYYDDGNELPVWGFSPDSGTFRPAFIEKTGVTISSNNRFDQSKAAVKLTYMSNVGNPSNQVSYRCNATLTGKSSELTVIKDTMESVMAKQTGWNVAKYPITFKVTANAAADADSTLDISVAGQAAHSGEAYLGKGANQRLLYLLAHSGATEPWQKIIAGASTIFPPDETEDNMGEALGVREGGREYDDLITVNLGILRYVVSPDLQEGVSFDRIDMSANVRYASPNADALTGTKHKTTNEIRQAANAKLKAAGLDGSNAGNDALPYTVPLDAEITTKLIKAYKDTTGIDVKPCILMGGTYATSWNNRPIDSKTHRPVSADVEGSVIFKNQMIAWGIDGGIGMHNSPELISVAKLIEGTKVLASAMVSLASDADVSVQDGGSGGGCVVGWGAAAVLAAGCAALCKFRKR